jgi:hypothetical protein
MNLRGDTVKAPGGIRADKAQSYKSIEQKAAKVRNVLAPALPVDEALPSTRLFDALDKMTVPTPYGDVQLEPAVKNLPPGVEGWTEYDKERNRIIVALDETTTYVALEKGSHRARFCLCHEVGHAVLHFCELMRTGAITHQMAALRRGDTLPHEKYMDTEWQANALAAALLMPAAGLAVIEKKYGFVEWFLVTQQFGVSSEAALYRLQKFHQKRNALLKN